MDIPSELLELSKDEKLMIFKLAINTTYMAVPEPKQDFKFPRTFTERLDTITECYIRYKEDAKL